MKRFFIWLKWKLYTRWERVYFTEEEVAYLIDIIDVWVEEHMDLGNATELFGEVQGVYENMAVAIDVREKLWRQLSQ